MELINIIQIILHFRRIQVLIFVMLLLMGCKKDKEEPLIYQVPAEAEIYVQRFLQEAKLRNKSIEINNLILEFEELDTSIKDGALVCAACQQTPGAINRQKKIIINTKVNCWRFYSDQAKEALIFHELGHCVLQRINHKDNKLPNGDFASIMNSESMVLYEICAYDIDGNDLSGAPCNQTFKRQYYLDELFDENSPAPAWSE